MASTINADNGVVSGSSGVKTTADTSGVLALQSNGTTGLTLNTSLALGVGSGNSTGSSGQVLTSAGSGAAPTWATPTVTSPAGSTGQVQYNNAGAFGAISSGTSGQVLTSAGSGAAPTWTSPSAGAMTLLATVTASNSATVSFDSTYITSAYSTYVVMFSGWVPSADSVMYAMKISANNLSTFISCRYLNYKIDQGTGTLTTNDYGTSSPFYLMNPGYFTTNADNGGGSGSVYIYNPSSTTAGKTISWTMSGYASAVGEMLFGGSATRTLASGGAFNSIQFLQSSGTISQGVFKLYGIS